MKSIDNMKPIMKIQESMSFEPINTTKRKLAAVWMILLTGIVGLLSPTAGYAQCDGLAVACNNIVQVSLNEDCKAFITPDVVLEDPSVDKSLYEVRVYDPDGNIIPDDTIRQDYDNVKLKVEVECKASGIYCWGYLIVEDKIKPQICVEPGDTSLTCFSFDFDLDRNELISKIEFSKPGDGECEEVELSFPPDLVETYNPCRDTIKKITRFWKVTDAAGNFCIDTQYIYVLRAPITDVVFPRDTVVDCLDEADLSVAKLGEPEIRSCENFLVSHEDIEIPVCGVSRKILRVWKVTDTCTDEDSTHTQVIKIEDNFAPTFDFTFFQLNPEMLIPDKHTCTATARNIPNPIILDCNLAQTTLEVFYQLVDNGGNPIGLQIPAKVNSLELFDLENVPIGQPFIVIFVANDGCGNISRASSEPVTVEDTAPPNAVCEGFTTVVLNSVSGEVEILAESFDDHSTDNCGVVRKEVRRLNSACPGYLSDLAFQDKIHFCCSDIQNNPVRVVFRVYDAAGNFSDCIVSVIVQDKRRIVIDCQPDLTFNCDFNLDNLQAELLKTSNLPDVTWVCGEKSLNVEIPDYSLSSCGLGSFSVKWVAMDVNGQMDSCYQQVTIDNISDPNISWPQTPINLNSCQGTTPEDLNSEPTVSNIDCEQIAVTYEDQVLKGEDNTYCVKILRTWSVIDWCKFDGGNAGSAIIGSFEQTIKISDTEAPQLLIPCTPFEVIDDDKTCDEFVELEFNAKDDCTGPDDLVYSFQIDEFADGDIDRSGNTNDASGVFPVGTHEITVSVEDQCGNISHCTTTFTITTKKEPIPVCQAVYEAVLTGNGSVTINANDLNLKSTDGCGSEDGLTFAFDSEGLESSVTYDCSDIPNGVFRDVDVNLWVIDAVGNREFCVVTIALSDRNQNFCPNDTSGAMVAGLVTDENFRSAANIEVQALNTRTGDRITTETDDNGSYTFELEMFDEYFIAPKLGGYDMTGVSTLDVVFIQQHILGLKSLNSSYKLLAADVNNSNSITAADLVELRRLILGTIPSLNQSWKFVNESFDIENANDPWIYPSGIVLYELNSSMDDASFIGLKVGDVSGDAFAALARVLANPRSTQNLEVHAAESGDQVSYAVRSSDAIDLMGLQLSLDYDQSVLELAGIEAGSLNLTKSDYSADRENGNIRISWTNPHLTEASETWFYLHFDKKTDGPVPNLTLDRETLSPEFYDGNFEVTGITLESMESLKKENEFTLYQNTPNPFNDQTAIHFYLPDNGVVELAVMDVSGKLVFKSSDHMKKGYNQMTIQRKDLRGSGIYYYTITTDTDKKSKRMIVLY